MPTTLNIFSTTSAFPFVQRWIAQYEDLQPESSGGLNVDYLADREINTAEGDTARGNLAIVGVPNETNNDTVHIPVSAQAIAIVYNIPSFPDIPSGLRLNSTTLFLIFNGSITQWDDPMIKELNPGLNLPDEGIIVVHSDEDDYDTNSYSNMGGGNSSSQLLLGQYLGLNRISWPKNDSITVSGPAELAEMVRKTPYSIGYVDFSYAIQTRMTYAAIGDAQGDYIVPSTESIGRAVDLALQFQNSSEDELLLQQQELHLPPPAINASRVVNESYPIVGLYYATLSIENAFNNTDGEEGKRRTEAVLDFVEWITSEGGGQQTLLEVQYPSIYSGNKQLAAYATATIDAVKKSLSSQ
jgi:ABC-type phosphate transport system substrate-binding protein